MRGHTTVSQCRHHHTQADLIWTICRRLVDEMQQFTTAEGLLDARECMEQGIRDYADEFGVNNVLLSKLYCILAEAPRREG